MNLRGVAYIEPKKIEKLNFNSVFAQNEQTGFSNKLTLLILKALDIWTTETEKDYIQQHYIEGKLLKQIATEKGISSSTVSRTIERGIAKVKKAVTFAEFLSEITMVELY